ncbi:MAG TPA: aminopeptidase, partial [Planctomycetes bacterium]|nr:aminopeptidase [Planctomycetota bacterium]
GGLPMPLPLTFTYEDGSTSELVVPASVWRRSRGGKVSKLFLSSKAIARIELDRLDAQADVDPRNNAFPPRIAEGRLRLTKEEEKKNPMQRER